MRSPFPGMDPYLESSWRDVHVKLVAFVAEVLTPLLPPGLRALSEEDLTVLGDDHDSISNVRPDVAVTQVGPARGATPESSTLLVPEPIRVHLDRSPPTEKRVVIVDGRAGNRVVTAIEILSKTNKTAGPGNRAYRRKLDAYRDGGVNTVEIDLLRHPRRTLLEVDQSHLPPASQTPYLISVRRAAHPDDWDIYPVALHNPIPPVHIPLRTADKDVVLHLQPCIDRAYAAGNYAAFTNYAVPPEPPLAAPDAAFAEQVLHTWTPARE